MTAEESSRARTIIEVITSTSLTKTPHEIAFSALAIGKFCPEECRHDTDSWDARRVIVPLSNGVLVLCLHREI
jgi:hypothetical protein